MKCKVSSITSSSRLARHSDTFGVDREVRIVRQSDGWPLSIAAERADSTESARSLEFSGLLLADILVALLFRVW